MENVCSTCGEQNAPGALFCSSCSAYLGWQQDPSPHPVTPAAGPSPAPEIPKRHRERHAAPKAPFEASIEDAGTTVPVDGSPATVAVHVANTSMVVDGYVVEAINAPPWLAVRPGTLELLPGTQGVAEAELKIEAATLVPAQQRPVLLRIRNTTGQFEYRDLLVQVTVPALDAPFEVIAQPQLVRSRDQTPGETSVTVDNSRNNQVAHVRLAASDPERVIRATWASPELQVPPGDVAHTRVRFGAPSPRAGTEVSRTITVTATDGRRTATTGVTWVQVASEAAIELLALRLDPSVLRLAGQRRGALTATLDNRRGTEPLTLSLRGDDPENSLHFTCSPARLEVPPGTVGSVRVTVRAPRTPPGREVTRPVTVVATDGHGEVRAEGSVVQQSSSRQGLARVLLTVLGGLAVLLGSMLQFSSGGLETATELTATRIAQKFNEPSLDARGAEGVVSVGLILILLAALMVFGLTGRSGRLTRLAALLGAAAVIAAFVALLTQEAGIRPESGALLAFVGFVTGYIGGLLGRR